MTKDLNETSDIAVPEMPGKEDLGVVVVDASNHHDVFHQDAEVAGKLIQQTDEDAGYLKEKLDDGGVESEGDVELDVTSPQQVPDGGYGWIIVLGSAFTHLIIGGFERADGVLFLKFISKFHQSAQATAWVGSLCSSIRLCLGPLVSAFCNRFSCRAAVITGGFVSAIGLFICGFTTNLIQLYFTFGIIAGIGRSLAYAPCLIITGLYFDKRRGLALGLATAGVGIGTFIVPPSIEFVFEEYGYFGAFLIMSAFSLNFLVCGALFRPLSVHRKILEQKRKNRNKVITAEDENNSNMAITSDINHLSHRKSLNHPHHVSTASISLHSVNSESASSSASFDAHGKAALSRNLSPWQKIARVFKNNAGKKTKKKVKFFEFYLLKNPTFLIFCVSILLFTASFKSGFYFLPALVDSSGISESNGALLLSITGAFDIIGRILAGLIFDVPRVKQYRSFIYNGIVFLIGLLSFIYPSVSTFAGFACVGSAYGFLTGSYISQKTMVIVDILGVDKLTSSFGLLICFQGFGSLLGPPLSGMMKDIYGHYDEAFYFCGGLMLVSCLIMLVGNIWQKLHSQPQNQT